MATPIVVNPSKPSQVVVGGGTQSGTPIKVTTDLDYNRVQSMINESIDSIDTSDLAKENTLRQGITSISAEIVNTTTPLAKEATLTHGVNTISQKIDDIHIPELDKSDLAKEATLSSGISTLSNKIDNIDLSSVENKVDEGVETLSNKIDNIDLSSVAKQGDNNEATNSKILEEVQNVYTSFDEIYAEQLKSIIG